MSALQLGTTNHQSTGHVLGKKDGMRAYTIKQVTVSSERMGFGAMVFKQACEREFFSRHHPRK
jgi:hypothetical protein